MAYDFATENAKTLRYAPDYVNITIKVGNETIMTLNKEDLISCVLSLRGVETKLDNPELQASTLEFEAYWPGSDEDITRFRGKNTIIEYQCGYVDGEKSKKRTFYAAFDEDGLTLRNHTLKISATDGVGAITGQNENVVTKARYQRVDDRWGTYMCDIYEPYLKHICNKLSADGSTIFQDNTGCPGGYDVEAYCDYGGNPGGGEIYTLIDNKSYRKTVAQFCNIFRGSDLANPDPYTERFVFRDAGIPVAGWCRGGIGNFAASDARRRDNILTWNLNYNDVSDFAATYGNPIKTVTIGNPRLGVTKATKKIEGVYFYKTAGSLFLKTEDYIAGISGYYGQYVESVDVLDGKTIKVTFRAVSSENETYGGVIYYPLYKVDASRSVSAHSHHTEGDVIRLEEFCGLSILDIYEPTVTTLEPIKNALHHTLNDCGLANPKWIEFTWRGHPNMQPRDILLFTEKDGSQNYYEIDNLTLEHVDGGLISKVKAIYKYPYQGE
jgi:hypothetical protein